LLIAWQQLVERRPLCERAVRPVLVVMDDVGRRRMLTIESVELHNDGPI
jgi:hypothetical protein